MNKRIFDDFDEYASNYRAIHNQNIKISGVDSFYFAEMKVELLKGFEKQDNLKVLDIGCGDGTSEIFFQKYFPNWIIYGIDISAESIAEAKKTNLPNCTFSVFDGLTVPFENCAFDLVFIAGVLHHVSFSMHSKIISEVNRVLNNNGRLYLFEHNPLNPLTRHLVNTCVFDKDAKLLFHFYTKKTFTNE